MVSQKEFLEENGLHLADEDVQKGSQLTLTGKKEKKKKGQKEGYTNRLSNRFRYSAITYTSRALQTSTIRQH